MLKPETIKVVVTNPPTKEESAQRIEELCQYLEEVWRDIPSKSLCASISNAVGKKA